MNIEDPNTKGFGEWWLVSSLSSVLFGKHNSTLQAEAQQRDLEFRQELEKLKEVTEDQKIQEEAAFKRKLLRLSRAYRQKESEVSFANKLNAMELAFFFERYWPMDRRLQNIIHDESHNPNRHLTLNVMISRFRLLPVSEDSDEKEREKFEWLEYCVDELDAKPMGGVKLWRGACPMGTSWNGNADIMNAHFLMSQLPTMIIIPIAMDGKIWLRAAIWDALTSAPIVKDLMTFDYDARKADACGTYLDNLFTVLRSAISVAIGLCRDFYNVFCLRSEPTLVKWLGDGEHEDVRLVVLDYPQIRNFILAETNNLQSSFNQKFISEIGQAYSCVDCECIAALISELLDKFSRP